MADTVFNTLFLCTGNSARSIIAESLLRHFGRERFLACSAGSRPAGYIHPFALELLGKNHFDLSSLRCKSWAEFTQPDSPRLDFVITVCDNAAGEACPVWPGQPITAHWGVPDPAAVEGSDEAKRQAFVKAMNQLQRRIGMFTSLPFLTLDRMKLEQRVREIGQ